MKYFYEKDIGEELLNPSIRYTDMKKNYPIKLIDLRFQVDHITPKKIHLFEELNIDLENVNARLFAILTRHR